MPGRVDLLYCNGIKSLSSSRTDKGHATAIRIIPTHRVRFTRHLRINLKYRVVVRGTTILSSTVPVWGRLTYGIQLGDVLDDIKAAFTPYICMFLSERDLLGGCLEERLKDHEAYTFHHLDTRYFTGSDSHVHQGKLVRKCEGALRRYIQEVKTAR